MSTAKSRKPIVIQAVPGKDDDLIYWLQQIPEGYRQGRLRATLRAGIEAERSAYETLASIDTIQRDIAALANYASGGQADDLLTVFNASLRELANIIQQESAATRELIGNAQFAPQTGVQAASTITAAPRLDAAELQRRKASIKAKAQW